MSDFTCMLAQDGRPTQKELASGRWLAQPKWDGMRALMICNGVERTMVTRAGKPILQKNVQHILDLVAERAPDFVGVLDGELYAGSWNRTMMMAKGPYDDTSELRFIVFDCLTAQEWAAQDCPLSLEERIDRLENLNLERAGDELRPPVQTATGEVVVSEEEAVAMTNDLVALGFEGLVIKNLDSKYVWKRSSAWRKSKLSITKDGVVRGVVEGLGKHVGRLGALIVEIDPQTTTRVGTGFTDAQRTELWEARESLIGRMVEFKEALNPAKMTVSDFPVFIRMRPDKE